MSQGCHGPRLIYESLKIDKKNDNTNGGMREEFSGMTRQEETSVYKEVGR